VVVLGLAAPASWAGFTLALLLTGAAMFSIGLLIGAAVPSPSAAQALTFVTWLPVMVIAGLWFPRVLMPPLMRRISDLSPGGAGVAAVQQAWFAGELRLSSLAVLAGFALVLGGLSTAAFRWE
jgi:ABC-2 type transport system permease protein